MITCPNCGFESLTGLRFCGRCGSPLTLICPNCQHANPFDYLFCGMCGIRLSSEAGPTQPLVEYQVPEEVHPIGPPIPRADPLVGERRVASVLMADVRNSTDLLELMGSEAWVEMMNQVLLILETQIYRFGGKIEQFRGDGLVATFGAGQAHEDDPERAVLSGLLIQEAVSAYARGLAEDKNLELKIRVGIHTGEVIVTDIGDASIHQEEDTAMGEALTIASRLENAAESGTALVSENTYRLVENKFTWQALGEISFKGMSKPMNVYRPVALVPDTEWAHEMEWVGAPIQMAGRDKEFSQLKTALHNLRNGRGGIAIVTGEKGMGKSLLVRQVRQYYERIGAIQVEAQESSDYVAQSTRTNWLRSTCRSYDQPWPYTMWRDLLQSWLNLHDDETSEQVCADLRCKTEHLWGDKFDRYYPYLTTLLSLPLEDEFQERVKHLDADGLRRGIYFATRSWLEALGDISPLVVSFGDMQWADTASLELLKHNLPVCLERPILWIFMFRSEIASPIWEFRHLIWTEYPHRLYFTELLPLDEEEARQLINQFTGGEVLSEKTVELIIKKSEGNPYFILEILRALTAEGLLTRDPKTGSLQESQTITSFQLPDSLQSLLLVRIDRLNPEERRVLQMAAVIGTTFWRDLLDALAEDLPQLNRHLNSLERMQLVQDRGITTPLGSEYMFNSTLLREAAYDSLLNTQRIAYHAEAARYLESLDEIESWSQYSIQIAYHFMKSGNLNKELYYTLAAAEQARKINANIEAYKHYSRAEEILDLLEGHPKNEEQLYNIRATRFEILLERSRISALMGNIHQGNADAKKLLQIAEQLTDDPIWRIDALLHQPEVHHPDREDLEAGLSMAQAALDLSNQISDKNRQMRSLIQLGNLHFILRLPDWEALGQRAFELAEELGDLPTQIELLISISAVHGMDNLERQKIFLESALGRSHDFNDKSSELKLLHEIGAQYERDGDYYRQMVEYEQERLRISREIGDRLAEGNALMYCGQIQGIYLGDYAAGLVQVEETFRIWEQISDRLFPLLRMAQFHALSGRISEAEETIKMVQPLVDQNVLDLGRVGLALVTSIADLAAGDLPHLNSVLETSHYVFEMVAANLASRQYQMAAYCKASAAHLGLIDLLVEGERETHQRLALEASTKAIEIYQEFGFTQIVECVSEEIFYFHGMALKANGRTGEARAYFEKAYHEMMRKHKLIPKYSPFRETYLNSIALHRQIKASFRNRYR